MSIFRSTSYLKSKIFFLAVMPLLMVSLFQNCSGADFKTDQSLLDAAQNVDLELENGHQFTNKKLIDVEIKLNTTLYDRMRVSSTSDFSNSPDLPVTTQFKYDLKDQWAPDGSKDGEKSVYVQLLIGDDKYKIINQTIGLDTVHPELSPKGILKTGLNNGPISLGDAVSIDWDGRDVPASTGFSSGIDPVAGLKLGYTSKEDCSVSQVTMLQEWTSYKNSHSLIWPQKNPLDTIYFCIYAKDRAGNLVHILSQPMTAIWKVLVGENSQGNGSDYLAPNVRFKKPATLEKDGQGNLFISDSEFHNIRVVKSLDSSTPGEISLFAGDGHPTQPINGDSLDISLAGGANSIVFDEDTNTAYISNARAGLFRVTMNADRTRGEVKKLLGLNKAFIALRNYKGKKSLLIYHHVRFVPESTDAQAYLYEIPWSQLTAMDSLRPFSELTQYRIAGNGTIPLSSYSVPENSVIGADISTSDYSQSVGRAGAMATSADGTIYLVSYRDGVALGWGHHLIRELKQREDGKFDQRIVGKQSWVRQVEVYKEKLYVASLNGFFEIDLKTLVVERPLPPEISKQDTSGVFVEEIEGKARIYISETFQSRVGVYDEDFELIYHIGRPVYKAEEDNALKAMVGQSDGVVETPNGELIYVDSLNHALRKVDNNGRVTTLFGGPDKGKFIDANNTPFSDTSFNGRTATVQSYSINLVGSFLNGTNILYMSTGAFGSVMALDLDQGVANTVMKDNLEGVGVLTSTRDKFALYGIAHDPSRDSIFSSRAYVLGKAVPEHISYTGFIGQTRINGLAATSLETQYAGDLSKGRKYFEDGGANSTDFMDGQQAGVYTSRSIEVSKDNLMYTSGYGGFKAHNLTSNSVRSIVVDDNLNYYLEIFEVFNDGGDDIIVYRRGEGLRYFKLNRLEVLTSSADVKVTSSNLCLPGTFLNYSRNFTKGADNNLIISDTSNGRILKYFISSSTGYKLQGCN